MKTRELAAAIAIAWCCRAAAAPQCKLGEVIELMPASANAGSVKVFAAREGFDAFWTAPKSGSQGFAATYAAFTRNGQRVGQPQALVDQPLRNVAPGPAGAYGLTYQASASNGWQGHVAMVVPGAAPAWDVALPSRERGHGTLAIGWDPRASAWIVAGEELIQLPDKPAGNVYTRLFVARLDRKGKLLEPPAYVSDEGTSASLGDWNNPLIVADGRAAFVWTATDGNTSTLYVTELDGANPKRFRVATARGFSRVVLVRTAIGYVLAGGESGAGIYDGRVFVATLRDGSASALRYISTAGHGAAEPVIATDGARVAIAWNEDETREVPPGPSHGHGPPPKQFEHERTRVHAAIIDAGGKLANAYTSHTPSGRTDWVQSIAWDGCSFALVHTTGINPSAIVLVRM